MSLARPQPKPSKLRSLKGSVFQGHHRLCQALGAGLRSRDMVWLQDITEQLATPSQLLEQPRGRWSAGRRKTPAVGLWGKEGEKGTCRIETAAQALPAVCSHSPRGPTSGCTCPVWPASVVLSTTSFNTKLVPRLQLPPPLLSLNNCTLKRELVQSHLP